MKHLTSLNTDLECLLFELGQAKHDSKPYEEAEQILKVFIEKYSKGLAEISMFAFRDIDEAITVVNNHVNPGHCSPQEPELFKQMAKLLEFRHEVRKMHPFLHPDRDEKIRSLVLMHVGEACPASFFKQVNLAEVMPNPSDFLWRTLQHFFELEEEFPDLMVNLCQILGIENVIEAD